VRRQDIRLGAWLLVLAATAVFVLRAEPPVVPAAATVQAVARAHPPDSGARASPEPSDASLTDRRAVRPAWDASGPDLFASDSVVAVAPIPQRVELAETPPPDVPAVTDPEPAAAAPVDPAPVFPYRALGQMQQDGERIAFLEGPHGPMLARAGASIAGDWVVDAISESTLQVRHSSGAPRTAIALPPTR
jgi:hypothetical protein